MLVLLDSRPMPIRPLENRAGHGRDLSTSEKENCRFARSRSIFSLPPFEYDWSGGAWRFCGTSILWTVGGETFRPLNFPLFCLLECGLLEGQPDWRVVAILEIGPLDHHDQCDTPVHVNPDLSTEGSAVAESSW
jgi:hypothetical protein